LAASISLVPRLRQARNGVDRIQTRSNDACCAKDHELPAAQHLCPLQIDRERKRAQLVVSGGLDSKTFARVEVLARNDSVNPRRRQECGFVYWNSLTMPLTSITLVLSNIAPE
jgi:hypothetical protein